MDNILNLSVTNEQLNFILNCLAKTPYEVSAGLIQSLVAQAQPQIAAMSQQETTAEEVQENSSESLQ